MPVDLSFLAQFYGASPVSGYQLFVYRRRVFEKSTRSVRPSYGEVASLTLGKQNCVGKRFVALEKKVGLVSVH